MPMASNASSDGGGDDGSARSCRELLQNFVVIYACVWFETDSAVAMLDHSSDNSHLCFCTAKMERGLVIADITAAQVVAIVVIIKQSNNNNNNKKKTYRTYMRHLCKQCRHSVLWGTVKIKIDLIRQILDKIIIQWSPIYSQGLWIFVIY
uniref:Uncharacterized protein n=1 Tax=Glossina brevipalpis TaxID=37001 RepID=A0A1A9WH82_9MUSC